MSVALCTVFTWLALMADAPPVVQVIDEKEATSLGQTDNVRLSLPTEEDFEAWQAEGLRLELGLGRASLRGSGPAWSFTSTSVVLRPSVRLDERWALGGAASYGGGPGGLRWSVNVEATFFIWQQLSVAAGIGYGGLSVSDVNRSSGLLRGPDELVSRNLEPGEELQSCTGSALSSSFRAQYLFVVGPLFASGPFVEGGAQWTRCEATFGRVDPETGRDIVLTQWWRQRVATFGWTFAWR